MIRTFAYIIALLFISACQSNPRFDVQFISSACIRPYYGYHYLTCHPLEVWINDRLLIIPDEFETDLATIPRVAWPIISPMHSSLIRPALLHDWLYNNDEGYSRLESDLIFYGALRDEHISRLQADIIYYSVRTTGWLFYKGAVIS
jgi:hypothetical protein